MKKLLILLSSFFATVTAVAGVYRHDKAEKEYTDLAAQQQFDCVGQVLHGGGKSGSCVLIGDKYVLCAAHVFKESQTRPDTIQNGTTTMVAYKQYGEHMGNVGDYSFLFAGKEYAGKVMHVYPTYMEAATKGMGDIVLIELREAVSGVAPAVVYTGGDEQNGIITGVGYGAWGVADKLESLNATITKKIAGENTIDSIGGMMVGAKGTVLYCDFDNPADATHNKMGSAIPLPLEYTCAGGDSGGGAFMKRGDHWELVGICSGNSFDVQEFLKIAYYSSRMSWTRVSAFAEWIKGEEGK